LSPDDVDFIPANWDRRRRSVAFRYFVRDVADGFQSFILTRGTGPRVAWVAVWMDMSDTKNDGQAWSIVLTRDKPLNST
jgi:hypothetical protein